MRRTSLMRWLMVWVAACGVAVLPGLVGAQPPTVQIIVSPAVKLTVQGGETYVGTVKPLRSSLVGSAVDGRVESFPVNAGDHVKRGAVLAQLRTRQIELEKAQAEGEAEALAAELQKLETGTRPELIEETRARSEAQAALVEYAEAKLKRMQALRDKGAATAEEFEEALMQRQNALKTLAAVKLLQIVAEKGPRAEEIAEVRGRLAAARARVDQLQDRIERHSMVSPFDGYVVEEHTEVGEWRKMGEPIARVIQLDEVEIEALVPERAAAQVRVGALARVEVAGLPAIPFTGTVSLIVPQADPRSRSLPVKVRVSNQFREGQPLIGAGQFARVTLSLGAEEDATLVPKDSIVLGGRAPRVFVYKPPVAEGGTATVHGVDVELGVASEGLIQVRGGVRPGDLVVVEGNERVFEGAPVLVIANRPASAAGARHPGGTSPQTTTGANRVAPRAPPTPAGP